MSRVSCALLLSWSISACTSPERNITVLVSPAFIEAETGQTRRFEAAISGTNNTQVTWSIDEGVIGGTIDGEGLYTAPENPGTFRVTATSVADPTRRGFASVEVRPAAVEISVKIDPARIRVSPEGSHHFRATVLGTSNTQITWSVKEGPRGGRILSSGTYDAPATEGEYHVVATPAADPSKAAVATVLVAPPPPITVTVLPDNPTVAPLKTQAFHVAVTGTDNATVSWHIEEGPAGGTVDPQGLYTAPAASGTYTVVAVSAVDEGVVGKTQVWVTPFDPIAVTVSPATATVATGDTLEFAAEVSNTTLTDVTWRVQEGSRGGTVSSAGKYTAPWTVGTFHLEAISAADPSKRSTAEIFVIPSVVSVTTSPEHSARVPAGGTSSFTASVKGAANRAIQWSIQEPDGGTIDALGKYTAPSTTGTYHAIATSVADPTKSAKIAVTVVSTGPFDISGQVHYSGFRSGRIYLLLTPKGATTSEAIGGTSIAAPGPFTIRGVQGYGEHTITAFLDSTGTSIPVPATSPSAPAVPVSINGANIDDLVVTLEEPLPGTGIPLRPSSLGVVAGEDFAWCGWVPVQTAMGYRVYWSNSPNPGLDNNLGSRLVPTGYTSVVISSLTPETDYYFSVAAFEDGIEGPAAVLATPVRIAASMTGTPVTGTVHFDGLAPGGPLYVVGLNAQGAVALVTRIFHPLTGGSFRLPGASAGRYTLLAVVDQNNNGLFDLVDPSNRFFTSPVLVEAADTPSPTTLRLLTGNAVARVLTLHAADDASERYVSRPALYGAQKLAVLANLSGPGLTAIRDLPLQLNAASGTIALRENPSTTPYRFSVTYADNSSEVFNVLPTVVPLARGLEPAGRASSSKPTFTWSEPVPAPAVYTTQITVGRDAAVMWTSPVLDSSVRSVTYAGPTLFSNNIYYWKVSVRDELGNVSERATSFDVP